MSEDSAMGEWVDPIASPGASPTRERSSTFKVRAENWASSSFDLFSGCDISESPDTVPGDLLDELFRSSDDAWKTPGK